MVQNDLDAQPVILTLEAGIADTVTVAFDTQLDSFKQYLPNCESALTYELVSNQSYLTLEDSVNEVTLTVTSDLLYDAGEYTDAYIKLSQGPATA